MTDLPIYYWPDLSPVVRRYIVVDDQGQYGVAHADNAYHPGVLFAHPVSVPAAYDTDVAGVGAAIIITDKPFHRQVDGSYTGSWHDSNTETRITIVDDLGWLMPDRWADQALAGSGEAGHWNYGAKLGKIGGEPPVKGQRPEEMTVGEAESFAAEAGEPVKARAIRLAAARGDIPGARRVGRDWLIPYEGFNHYLDHRPKPGPKGPRKATK